MAKMIVKPTQLEIVSSYTESHYDDFKKGNKHIFEDVVNMLMVEYIPAEIQDKIKDLPRNKVRGVLLGMMDNDRGLFARAKALIKDNVPKLKHIKDIIPILRDYVKVGDVEKKKYGEVMTPISLVEEMLETLPKEVWSNPDLKWLDPCNGSGPFLAIVVLNLMKGLKKWEPDEDKRYKHILENMIYACELQPKNQFIWLSIMDPYYEYNMNVYTGSFLDEGFDKHMKNVWGVENFDVVVGNPPYNAPMVAEGKRGGGDTLWDKFVIKIINILKEYGYLVFIHPTMWRKPNSDKSTLNEVSKLLKSKQMILIKMHNSKHGMDIFKAGTRFDYYLLKNQPINNKTTIIDEENNTSYINLKTYSFIPNKNIEFINNIIAKKDDIKCPIICSRSIYDYRKEYVSLIETDEYKYPLIHTTTKSGTRYMYSSRNDKGHFGIPKIIFGDSGIYLPIIDIDGKYGMTVHSMAIAIDNIEEGENINIAITSDKFKIFLESVLWSNYQLDPVLFTYLKKDFWKEFI